MSEELDVETVKMIIESLIRHIAELSLLIIDDERLICELVKSVGMYDLTMEYDFFVEVVAEHMKLDRTLCLAKICQILEQIPVSEEIRIDNIASLIVYELSRGVSRIRWSDCEEAMMEHEQRNRDEQYMRSHDVQHETNVPKMFCTSPILSEETIRATPELPFHKDNVPNICEEDALEHIEGWTDRIAEQASQTDEYMTDFFQIHTQEKYQEVIGELMSLSYTCEWYLVQAKDYYNNTAFKNFRYDFLREMLYIERIFRETSENILSLHECAARFMIAC